jgi:hypothetical protein
MQINTRTRGNVDVRNIKIGDIHFEYSEGYMVKSQVLTTPVLDTQEWSWRARNLQSGEIIDYQVCARGLYAPNLFDYEAFSGYKQI